MSKTVSGQDVEDMLSSVRRLVSSELPPHRRITGPPNGEKLVLTEEQRVKQTFKRRRPRSRLLEERIAELEAAVSKSSQEWEPDGSEDQAQHQPDHMVYTPPAKEEGRRGGRRMSRLTFLEAPPPPAEAEEESSATNPSEAEIRAATRDAVKDAVKEVVSEHSAFDEALRTAVQDSMAEEAKAKPAEPPATRRIPSEPPAVPQAAPEPPAPVRAAPVEQAEEPEREIAPPPPTLKTSLPQHDPVPAQTEARPAAQPSKAPKPRPAQTGIDPEALRPIVNRLIREELQGEIGERITRNVRKLVRQEIQRALSLHELD